MAKPILLIELPKTEAVEEISKNLDKQSLSEDYHILVYSNNREKTTFKIISENKFNKMKESEHFKTPQEAYEDLLKEQARINERLAELKKKIVEENGTDYFDILGED